MNSIILNPIFQIVTTAILTLLGTAWITRHFYKKHKKDNDKPKIKYWVENFNNKPLLRLERSPFDHIHNFTLTSISQYSKTNYCPWRESIKSLKSYEIDIPFQIPKPQCNMYSFKVKIQYQYKEHKYTDILTVLPSEEKCILH